MGGKPQLVGAVREPPLPQADVSQETVIQPHMGSPLSSLPIPWHTEKSCWEVVQILAEEAAGVDLPQCQKCTRGFMVPLSDFGPRGASLEYKVWACINPTCGFTIRIDKGIVVYGVKVGESKRRLDEP